MRRTIPRLRPPRLAAWLVELFAAADKTESILGDLHEEFSDICSKSGVAAARRWYWRQSLKSIAHLAARSFRTAPWSLAGVVLKVSCSAGSIFNFKFLRVSSSRFSARSVRIPTLIMAFMFGRSITAFRSLALSHRCFTVAWRRSLPGAEK